MDGARALKPLVTGLLQANWADAARVRRMEIVRRRARSTVWRCHVEAPDIGPHTVIVKQMRTEFARGFNDWAGLEFLDGVVQASVGPMFLGGDERRRFFVMTDAGDAGTLSDWLANADEKARLDTLSYLAARTADLSGSTARRERSYDAIREALPDAGAGGRRADASAWLEGQDRACAWWEAFGLALPAGYSEALRRIAATYARPTGFLGFTHGDMAPSNVCVARSGVSTFVDFEYSGFRHALYDITAWQMLCPLPMPWVERMRDIFRIVLGTVCKAARDEERFAEAWATMCAYRGLAILAWISPDILRRDRAWAEHWTRRRAVLVAASRLRAATEGFAALVPVHAAASALEDRLRVRWRTLGDPLPEWTVTRPRTRPL
jgi:hypothetical protein